ncbi:peptidase S24 [Pacificimonas flava]|uniref:Peptidase S24 n=2 Tax=Pacificimonas TaxID=1960290 RepID=A0A219B5S1_9SPHN|nr:MULTISPECIES: S24 family peptidase [Pacificimonas]MBZ6379252.1 helix-turn-helix transcriptional regulator [Pacificimonas aurantium]OWV33534.1 peptidase S24 [Pacificimonas flava]
MTDTDAVRRRLDELIRDSADDYASVSRLLGRNAAYIQQFIKRGVPKKLDGDDRRILARHFGVRESELGGPPPSVRSVAAGHETEGRDFLLIPYFAGIGASAGAGATLADREDAETALAFRREWIGRLGVSKPDDLSVIRVQGDSMLPTLGDGDPILVDRGDTAERLRDGIYVMRSEETLIVKRVTRSPASHMVRVTSDNPVYPDIGDCDPADIDLIGRVVWVGRQLR